jgi:hypothetical protein
MQIGANQQYGNKPVAFGAGYAQVAGKWRNLTSGGADSSARKNGKKIHRELGKSNQKIKFFRVIDKPLAGCRS